MNYPPYWGPPQPFYGMMPPAKSGMTIEDILTAEASLKALKDAFKKEADDKKKDDEKKKGPKAPTFSLGAVFGFLSIGSIPFVLMQLMLLDWARQSIAVFLKVPTP